MARLSGWHLLSSALLVLTWAQCSAFVPSPATRLVLGANLRKGCAPVNTRLRLHSHSPRTCPQPLCLRAMGAGLEEQQFFLPLAYSLCAGLSTGLGGLSVFLLRDKSPDTEAGVSAMMLGAAAAAMVTVSFVDLFLNIAHTIGYEHTLACSAAGAATVLGLSFLDLTGSGQPVDDDESSDARLGRLGVLTAITLTAHNFPEGMAVAISTLGSAKLGLKLAVAIALHNIPEGLAIACPLLASKQFSPQQAVGVTLASGLSEPVAALLTLLFFKTFITQDGIDYALAFVGGVMGAVALGGLLPEALRLQKPAMTAAGLGLGTVVMGLSLYALG